MCRINSLMGGLERIFVGMRKTLSYELLSRGWWREAMVAAWEGEGLDWGGGGGRVCPISSRSRGSASSRGRPQLTRCCRYANSFSLNHSRIFYVHNCALSTSIDKNLKLAAQSEQSQQREPRQPFYSVVASRCYPRATSELYRYLELKDSHREPLRLLLDGDGLYTARLLVVNSPNNHYLKYVRATPATSRCRVRGFFA